MGQFLKSAQKTFKKLFLFFQVKKQLKGLGLPTFEIRNKGHFKGLAPWPRAPLGPPLHQSYRFFLQ